MTTFKTMAFLFFCLLSLYSCFPSVHTLFCASFPYKDRNKKTAGVVYNVLLLWLVG